MSKFWHTEPIVALGHRPSTLPDVFRYPLYPAAIYSNGTEWDTKASPIKPFGHTKMVEFLDWCSANCKSPFTWSEKYGSLYFSDERDRALFRLFFSDETMPEPVFYDPQYDFTLKRSGWR